MRNNYLDYLNANDVEVQDLQNSLLVIARKKIILPEEKKIKIDFSNEDLAGINIDNFHKTSSGIILSI
jgi:hypothetical protein